MNLSPGVWQRQPWGPGFMVVLVKGALPTHCHSVNENQVPSPCLPAGKREAQRCAWGIRYPASPRTSCSFAHGQSLSISHYAW